MAPAAATGPAGPEGVAPAACPVPDVESLDALLDETARRFDAADLATALACAEAAARLAPRSVEAHHDRAAALAAIGRPEEARLAYVWALALDPDDPVTLAGAADLYINELAASREHALIGLEYARRGFAHRGRRRDDRALAARLALLEAQALDDLGAADEALARVEASLAIDPSSDAARYQRGIILFHLCRFDGARRVLEEALARAPDDAFVHHHLGLVLEREGAEAEAESHLAAARRLAPESFPQPVLLPAAEFRALVDQAIAELDLGSRELLRGVTIEIADLPALADLVAVQPPFSPTILGLYRGPPVLGDAGMAVEEGRSIVLYRKNLGRAVSTRQELERQIRMTLWHEIGHLMGRDEDELRSRGLE